MGKILIILCFVAGAIILVVTGGAITDATNADVLAPMPTPYASDTNSDQITMGIEVDPQVAIVDELTDYARDVSQNQMEQARDSNQAIAAVAITGYGTIGAIEASHAFRDVALAICAVAGLFLIWQIRKPKKDGER